MSKTISQKIIDYAIWYYLRYYPSRKKLAIKLREKFGPDSEKGKKYGGISDETIEIILSEHLRNIIKEEEVLRAKIKNLQAKGKNINYIKNNLLQKYFEKNDIEKILETEYSALEKSILDERMITKRIIAQKQKGKSKNAIRQKFIERSVDKSLIEKLLLEVFDEEGEFENLRVEYEKLSTRHDKQKIIEKLLRKGFRWEDVKRVVE